VRIIIFLRVSLQGLRCVLLQRSGCPALSQGKLSYRSSDHASTGTHKTRSADLAASEYHLCRRASPAKDRATPAQSTCL
jgi:hypothetical protein